MSMLASILASLLTCPVCAARCGCTLVVLQPRRTPALPVSQSLSLRILPTLHGLAHAHECTQCLTTWLRAHTDRTAHGVG